MSFITIRVDFKESEVLNLKTGRSSVKTILTDMAMSDAGALMLSDPDTYETCVRFTMGGGIQVKLQTGLESEAEE